MLSDEGRRQLRKGQGGFTPVGRQGDGARPAGTSHAEGDPRRRGIRWILAVVHAGSWPSAPPPDQVRDTGRAPSTLLRRTFGPKRHPGGSASDVAWQALWSLDLPPAPRRHVVQPCASRISLAATSSAEPRISQLWRGVYKNLGRRYPKSAPQHISRRLHNFPAVEFNSQQDSKTTFFSHHVVSAPRGQRLRREGRGHPCRGDGRRRHCPEGDRVLRRSAQVGAGPVWPLEEYQGLQAYHPDLFRRWSLRCS